MGNKDFKRSIADAAKKAVGTVSEAFQTVKDFSDMGKYPESPRVDRSDSEAKRIKDAMERQGQIPKKGKGSER